MARHLKDEGNRIFFWRCYHGSVNRLIEESVSVRIASMQIDPSIATVITKNAEEHSEMSPRHILSFKAYVLAKLYSLTCQQKQDPILFKEGFAKSFQRLSGSPDQTLQSDAQAGPVVREESNFAGAYALCKSKDQKKREQGLQYFKALVEQADPLAPFARIELAQNTASPEERCRLLFPVLLNNESPIPDEHFVRFQLHASNLMLQAYKRKKQLGKAFICATNALALIFNNDGLPVPHPSLDCYINAALNQISTYLRSDVKKIAIEWPDFNEEAFDICMKIGTFDSAFLCERYILEKEGFY